MEAVARPLKIIAPGIPLTAGAATPAERVTAMNNGSHKGLAPDSDFGSAGASTSADGGTPTSQPGRNERPSSLFMAREMESLPPRVRQAVDAIRFALTLKAGDMDGISAVNIARDAGIVANELQRQIKGRTVRP